MALTLYVNPLLGFLAHKYRIKYPQFGEKTCQISTRTQNNCHWILALSRGGLTAPSKEFENIMHKFEDIFNGIHGQTISKCKSVIRSVTKIISQKFPDFPSEVIHTFVKTRTFIRIKHLNGQLKIEADSTKKRNAEKKKHFTK